MNQFLTLIVLFVLTMQTVYFIFNATQREDLHKYEHMRNQNNVCNKILIIFLLLLRVHFINQPKTCLR